MATTMQDIARLAGVSRVAVSYALNGRPGVSAQVRERILSIAREVGFSPNAQALALRGATANAVGLVLQRPSSGFHQELISGMQIALSERGFGLVLQFAASSSEELAIYRRWHAERRVDGIVVCDPRIDDERIPALRRLGLPTVVIGGSGDYAGLANLWSDEAAAAAKAAGYLHALGHRRVALAPGTPGTLQTAWRTAAFTAACHTFGLTLTPLPFSTAASVSAADVEVSAASAVAATAVAAIAVGAGVAAARVAAASAAGASVVAAGAADASVVGARVADAGPVAAGVVGAGGGGVVGVVGGGGWPTAIVYDNDLMAIAGLRAALERGLSVPGDLSVVSWEDSALCQAVRPALSVLRRNLSDIGVAAIRLLFEWIDGQAPRSVQHENATFVVRGSTTAPR